MAWEICITNEGWNEIYEACHRFTKEELVAALADDDFERDEHNASFVIVCNEEYWDTLKSNYDRLYQDTLADLAFERIQENNTCDNGGYRYWIDREGYHAVELTD